jgi:hypothetical protein
MASSNRNPFSNRDDRDDSEESLDCRFCGIPMGGYLTIEDRPTRTLITTSCEHSNCRKGRGATLVINGVPSTASERELDARRDQLRRGLSPRRLAGAVRNYHGAGTYEIHKIKPHAYEIRGSDNWDPEAAESLASEIADLAPHLVTEVTSAARAVTVRDTRFDTDRAQVARPDGGHTPEQAHRRFQRQGPIGAPDTGDFWADRGI